MISSGWKLDARIHDSIAQEVGLEAAGLEAAGREAAGREA
jgi:hypothetical protein